MRPNGKSTKIKLQVSYSINNWLMTDLFFFKRLKRNGERIRNYPLYLILTILSCVSFSKHMAAQVTVFSDDFSTNTSVNWTTSGAINGSAWSVLRSGDDFGGRRNTSPQQLEFTNDIGAATNLSGWVFGMTPTTSFSSPYNPVLSLNSGVVTWTFNIRQIRTDPSGYDSGNYGVAFILAGETATTSTNGNGYAIVYGQAGSTDPVRLVRYTAGIMGNTSLTNIIISNTTGLTDFGAEYLSIKVTYNPCLDEQWELFVRNDGTAGFTDPLTGTLVTQGTAQDTTYTDLALDMMAGYWNGSTTASQTSFIDNVTVSVSSPPTATAGSYGPVCTNDPNVTLMGSPSGGVWTGIGVNGNTFDPTAGTQTITYTVTDVNGCTDSDPTTITVNPCITPPEMRWVLLQEDDINGSCTSDSNCDGDTICYGLQYTPNMTGTLTSYTTAFFIECDNGNNSYLDGFSCRTTSSVDTVINGCGQFDMIQVVASGNTVNVPVTQGVSIILHQVCFSVPTEILSIQEDEVSDLTTSIDSIMGGGPESEFPFYQMQEIDPGLACALLPLRFLNFTATHYAELKSQLDWVTADEINNSHFEVQRSNDGGKSFSKIGTVHAHQDARDINHYQFIDHFAKPGQNYYRLKQIDLDGRSEYTPVRNVYFGNGKFNVEAWPNPVSDVLFIQINDAEESGTIRLIDISGREVLFMNSNSGSEKVEVSVNTFPPGAYTLLIDTGMNKYQQKIIITGN